MKNNFLGLLSVLCILLITLGCEKEGKPDVKGIRPIVFVHGMAGTGDQFEAQALRFASNGYPENYFTGFDHNTIWPVGDQQELDQAINQVLAATGAEKIDLIGHSMGTSISQEYLSDRINAAKVAHYINIDGGGADALPGGVPTLSIISAIGSGITDATNVWLNQTHVQGASSVEAFECMYEFLTGEAPSTTEILPSTSSTIDLKGRFVVFITNNVPLGYRLSIYEVDPSTGYRLNSTPDYQQAIGRDGNFSFPGAKQGASYEFSMARRFSNIETHWYYEPFVRTDTLIRLKFVKPYSILYSQIDETADSSAVIIVRNKEMQGGDSEDMGVDSIIINGVEVCDGVLPGGPQMNSSGPMGLIVFDEDTDGIEDLSGVGNAFSSVPFVNSLDYIIPASTPADSTVNISINGRKSTKTQTINLPNWESIVHKSYIQFLPY